MHRLPSCQQAEIEQNFVKISQKTEAIQHIFKEQYTAKQLKFLIEKVKSFVPVMDENPAENECKAEEIPKDTKHDEDNSSATSSRISKLIEECEKSEKVEECEAETIKIPEVQKHIKKVLENPLTDTTKRKLKLYESPLEFLNADSSINSANKRSK